MRVTGREETKGYPLCFCIKHLLVSVSMSVHMLFIRIWLDVLGLTAL